jgi:hypothetical protein
VIAGTLKQLLLRLVRSRSKPGMTIDDLKGKEISTVAFVRDYVEFHFDGPILRSIADPRITIHDRVFQFPDRGSRDALCGVIGSTVTSIELQEGRSCELAVSNDARITIPLDIEHQHGYESMHFCIPGVQPMYIW